MHGAVSVVVVVQAQEFGRLQYILDLAGDVLAVAAAAAVVLAVAAAAAAVAAGEVVGGGRVVEGHATPRARC